MTSPGTAPRCCPASGTTRTGPRPGPAPRRRRPGLAAAAAAHLPEWEAPLTPHVLRHFCASQAYLGGMDLLAIQEALGHAWVATTMGYVHIHATHVEDAWIAGQERAAMRLGGLAL